MSEYLKKIKQQISDAETVNGESVKKIFDHKLTPKVRLAAIKNTGTVHDAASVKKLIKLVTDPKANEVLRAEAMKLIPGELRDNEVLVNTLLSYIKDVSTPMQVRKAALWMIQTSLFSSPLVMSKMPDYINALKSVLYEKEEPAKGKPEDPKEQSLKETAMGYLALKKDKDLQDLLVAGLKYPSKKITEPEMAIHLLSYDLESSAAYYPLMRSIVQNPPNVRSKMEALRFLSGDADSQDLLKKILEDKTEDPEVRHICAVALESLHSAYLVPTAQKLILDQNEDQELKAALLNTLTHTNDPTALYYSGGFGEKLDSVQQQSQSVNLKKMYTQLKNDVDSAQNSQTKNQAPISTAPPVEEKKKREDRTNTR